MSSSPSCPSTTKIHTFLLFAVPENATLTTACNPNNTLATASYSTLENICVTDSHNTIKIVNNAINGYSDTNCSLAPIWRFAIPQEPFQLCYSINGTGSENSTILRTIQYQGASCSKSGGERVVAPVG
ncbi:hypothetical protein HDU76_007534, partial [Blyttiomyces sp. JEL0837]